MMVLAVLAVGLKVLTPPGFMVAAPTNDLPFAIVICTGNGPLSLEPGQSLADHGGKEQAPGGKIHESPCAFAGLAAAAEPPSALNVAPVQFVAYRAVQIRPVASVAPGRGLAAPPLPARGPPSLLI
jgi:hypothetical protein